MTTVYVYKGLAFPEHKKWQMLSMVVADHDDEMNDAWQEWFEEYLASLDMEELWRDFTNDYVERHGDELMEKFKKEIQEVEVME